MSKNVNIFQSFNHKLLPWVVWVLGALFYAYEYLLRVMPNAMASELMQAFTLSAETLGGLAVFYHYAYVPMQLPVGVMMDRYGPRRLLTLACVVCAVGSYLFVQIHNVHLAQLGRFLVGFGSAFAFVGVLKLSASWFAPNRFAFLSGLASSLGVVGGIFGVVLMTALVEKIGWMDTVVYSAHFGIILAVIIYLIIRDQPKANMVTNLQHEHEELTLKDAFKNFFQIIKNPHMWLVGVIGCFLYLPSVSFADMWGEIYLEQAHHMSKIQASFANACIFLGWGIFSPITGYWSDRLKRRREPMIISGVCAAIIFSLFLFLPNLSHTMVFILMFLLGVAYSGQPIVFAVAREISPTRASGSAVATTNMLVMLGGGMLLQPLVGTLLDWWGDSQIVNGVHIYSVGSYQFALVMIPVGLMIASLLTLLLPETFGESYQREIKGR